MRWAPPARRVRQRSRDDGSDRGGNEATPVHLLAHDSLLGPALRTLLASPGELVRGREPRPTAGSTRCTRLPVGAVRGSWCRGCSRSLGEELPREISKVIGFTRPPFGSAAWMSGAMSAHDRVRVGQRSHLGENGPLDRSPLTPFPIRLAVAHCRASRHAQTRTVRPAETFGAFADRDPGAAHRRQALLRQREPATTKPPGCLVNMAARGASLPAGQWSMVLVVPQPHLIHIQRMRRRLARA